MREFVEFVFYGENRSSVTWLGKNNLSYRDLGRPQREKQTRPRIVTDRRPYRRILVIRDLLSEWSLIRCDDFFVYGDPCQLQNTETTQMQFGDQCKYETRYFVRMCNLASVLANVDVNRGTRVKVSRSKSLEAGLRCKPSIPIVSGWTQFYRHLISRSVPLKIVFLFMQHTSVSRVMSICKPCDRVHLYLFVEPGDADAWYPRRMLGRCVLGKACDEYLRCTFLSSTTNECFRNRCLLERGNGCRKRRDRVRSGIVIIGFCSFEINKKNWGKVKCVNEKKSEVRMKNKHVD